MAASSSSQHVTELLSSLKKLFDSAVYTDLKIVCGNDQHQVHKAIVCLRSGRLAQLCSEIGPNQEATITIPDDDPQTIDLMLQYLYTLEYSPRAIATTPTPTTTKPPTNGVNGINGHHHKDDITPTPPKPAATNGGVASSTQQQQQLQSPATTLEYNIEREAFEAIPATESASKSLSKAAKKKKKRASTATTADTVDANANAAAAATATVPEQASSPSPPSTTTNNAAAQTVPPAAAAAAAIINNEYQQQQPIISSSSRSSITSPLTTTTKPPQHSLLQHARLYTLAQKYGVPGLRALSASRFAAEAEEYWSSDDFLAAAVEAYNHTPTTSTTPKQQLVEEAVAVVAAEEEEEGGRGRGVYGKPKTIRDVVLAAMKAHPELLDRSAVREAIRVHAELSFDLMMYFRDNQVHGGSASSVVSM